MYNQMDSHFRVDYQNAKSKKEAIFQGQKYRITVLTERLVRLEFNKNGLFFDDKKHVTLPPSSRILYHFYAGLF